MGSHAFRHGGGCSDGTNCARRKPRRRCNDAGCGAIVPACRPNRIVYVVDGDVCNAATGAGGMMNHATRYAMMPKTTAPTTIETTTHATRTIVGSRSK